MAENLPLRKDSQYSREALEALPTKKLLALRDLSYRTRNDSLESRVFDECIPRNLILEILKSREHVPNKQEARKIRQQKASERKHR